MNKKSSTALVCGFGVLQLAATLLAFGSVMNFERLNVFGYFSDPLLQRLNNPELTLILGNTFYLFSTVMLVALLEKKLLERNTRGLASLLGTLPLASVGFYFFMPQGTKAISPEDQEQKDGQILAAGLVVAVTVGMVIFGGYFVTQLGQLKDNLSAPTAAEANRKAFESVQEIIEAQKSYKKKDWDGDGEKEFALFIVHLWRTARLGKDPVDVNLISEQLAVARVAELAYGGYSFRNLYFEEKTPQDAANPASNEMSRFRRLNYQKEWALIAEPQIFPDEEEKNKSLLFLAFSDGRIFARPNENAPMPAVPFAYEKHWSPVSSLADIEKLQ